MNKTFVLSLFAFFFIAVNSTAHEGHETPGALPPPPNGGRIAEAAHAEEAGHKEHTDEEKGHDHKEGEAEHEEEPELFIEAKLDGTKLKIYAHSLEADNTMVFKSLTPGPKLVLMQVKVELPRSKKSFVVSGVVSGDHWEVETGKTKDKRLLVYPTIKDGLEQKTARIQIEK